MTNHISGPTIKDTRSRMPKPRPAFKVWLETDEGYVFGPGVYSLLKKIEETGTLKESAEALGMSYRYAWGLLRKAEERLGEPLVTAHKGGRSGGGGAELTGVGRGFIEDFERMRRAVSRASEAGLEDESRATLNEVRGFVEACSSEGGWAEVSIVLKELTSLELKFPADSLSGEMLRPGDEVSALIRTSAEWVRRKRA